MTFEHPGAWAWALLAVPIVVLHLHLRRRRVVEVSSLELWRGLAPDRSGRGGLRHIRDGLALAMIVAALVALTASAMGPVTGAPASGPRRLAIVLDTCATMNARTSDGRTRLDDARDAASAAVSRIARHDEVCVWAAGFDPQVVVEPTHDAAAAALALAGVKPTLAPSSLARTTRLALSAARGVANRPATVLVVTDAVGAATLRDVIASETDLRIGIVDADRAASSSGIVACDVDPADARRVLVTVETTDGPAAPRSLVCGGATVPLAFDAEGRASAAVPLGASKGLVAVRLDPPDDFAEDDVARLTVNAGRPLAVTVVASAPSPFLVEALRAMPDVADPARTTLAQPGTAVAGADVVVADGVAPPRGVPSLTFGAGDPSVERPLLWGVGAHPVLAGVDLAPLRIERAALVERLPGDVAIVATSAGAVGTAGESGGARHVTFGFRPEASTLPLEAAFPLLVRNALRWLAGAGDAPRFVVAGEPLPGGDGATAPFPVPGEAKVVRLPLGGEAVVRWTPPAGFRLTGPSAGPDEAARNVVARLTDRRLDGDTRVRYAPMLAAAGAVLLAAGALLLGFGVASRRTAPPPQRSEPAALAASQ